MPIRTVNPFQDPTLHLNPTVNPYVAKIKEGLAGGEMPVLFGPALAGKKGHWHQQLPKAQDLVLEIGCHKGDVLAALAKDHPHLGFIGFDITFKRVVETALKGQKLGNLWSLLANGRALGELFAPGELSGVILFFPDPWARKKKQMKNRLVNESFVKNLGLALKSGGFFWFKTDHYGYYKEVEGFMEEFGFVKKEAHYPRLLSQDYKSRFEIEFDRRYTPSFAGVWQRI